MNYQQPPPLVIHPNALNGRPGQYPQAQIPSYQSQPVYPQPPQPSHPQQPYVPQPQPHAAPQPSVARRNPKIFSNLRSKIAMRYDHYRKMLMTLGAIIFAACLITEFLNFDFGHMFLFIAVHLSALVCTMDAYKQNRLSFFGAGIAFQFVSMWRLATIFFGGIFTLITVPAIIVLQAWYIILAVNMEIVANKNATRAFAPASAANGEASVESDVVNEFNEQSYLPSQGNPTQYSSISGLYPQVHDTTMNVHVPPQAPQVPPQVPSTVGLAEAQLVSKYHASLDLLQEMNFEKNPGDRVRNARLLEKYAGNIQDVVTELLSES